VTQKLVNAGFNCIATQVVIVADGWEHADLFLEMVEDALARAPDRPAYYPGAEDRRRTAAAEHPDTVTVGDPPRTFIRNLDPTRDHSAFTEELFCAVLASTRLPHTDPGRFLDAAVEFANDRLTGTLAAGIIVDPVTRNRLGSRFDTAVADLRYGCVGVNVWTAFGFLEPRVPWGAYPGHTLDEVGSGIGAVHNALMFDRPEKCVVTGPFRPFPRAWASGSFHLSPAPPWFIGNRTGAVTAELIARFVADPSPRRLPAIFRSALRA
jgi:aldehyde dehydrogenase (NAD(P)+)